MGRHRRVKANVHKFNGWWWTVIPGRLNISVFESWREAYNHAHTNTPIPVKVK